MKKTIRIILLPCSDWVKLGNQWVQANYVVENCNALIFNLN
jgi:hypothetical protein